MDLGGTLILGRATDNVFYPVILDQVAMYPDFNVAYLYKFKIARHKSGLIQVFVDKGLGYSTIPLLEAIDLAYAELCHFGWREDTQTASRDFYVDWIQARKPTIEKPAIKEKPAQDNLITQVSAKSGKSYTVAKLKTGIKQFTDRNFTITAFPPYLEGASFIQTAMDDKLISSDDFLTFFLQKNAIVYIGYDPRGTSIPAWLSKWTKTGDVIGSTDPGSNYLEVYSRQLNFWEVYPRPLLLGGNLASPASGAKMNYFVAAIELPAIERLQAEDAFVSGAVVANNHTGYTGTGFVDFVHASNDFIEWTVNIAVPGTYNFGFSFANGSPDNRQLKISDNGREIATANFIPLASWNSWAFLNGPHVYLSNGLHKIRATAIGTSGPNIDLLSLFYSSASAPAKAARRDIAIIPSSNNPTQNNHYVYPNPFVNTATINYTVKEKAIVNLSIYTLQGQQLQILVNGVRQKGVYQATLDGAKLSNGIYLYRLQTGNDVKMGKLVKQ